MGGDRVTVRNLKVVQVDAENNLLRAARARSRARRAATSIVRKAIAAQAGCRSRRPRSRRRAQSRERSSSSSSSQLPARNGDARAGSGQLETGSCYETRHRQRQEREGRRARSERRRVRRPREDRSDLGIGRPGERLGAARHARDEEPRARQRQRQEAVAAEGHRPGAGRRDPQPAVAQGRHGVRTAAAQLRLRPAEEGASAARCARRSRRSSTTARSIVVDRLEASDGKTKATAELFKRLGATGKTLRHRREAGRGVRA